MRCLHVKISIISAGKLFQIVLSHVYKRWHKIIPSFLCNYRSLITTLMSLFLPGCKWAKTNQFEWAVDAGHDSMPLVTMMSAAPPLPSGHWPCWPPARCGDWPAWCERWPRLASLCLCLVWVILMRIRRGASAWCQQCQPQGLSVLSLTQDKKFQPVHSLKVKGLYPMYLHFYMLTINEITWKMTGLAMN